MYIGTVKWYDVFRGFGFIQSDASKRDVFIHNAVIKSSGLTVLSDGQHVSFDAEKDLVDPARLTATHVSLA